MKLVIFGANGPTGRLMVKDALARGHAVRAVTRRPDAFPSSHEKLEVVRADVTSGAGLGQAIAGCDAVASVLGAPFSRRPITVYSEGTRAIVAGMDEAGCKRLVVASAGLTYPPPKGFGFFTDRVILPFIRNVVGRTLYADMRAMEELLRERPDLEWTVVRPGRLVDEEATAPYRKEPDASRRMFTTRADLSKVILDDIETGDDLHQAIAITSR